MYLVIELYENMISNKYYLKHVASFLPSLGDVFWLVQHALRLVRLVQVSYELRLQIILHIIHKEMHYSLRYWILDGFAYNVEVRLDQSFWNKKILIWTSSTVIGSWKETLSKISLNHKSNFCSKNSLLIQSWSTFDFTRK